jgi:phosphate transport system ATP-binding protein
VIVNWVGIWKVEQVRDDNWHQVGSSQDCDSGHFDPSVPFVSQAVAGAIAARAGKIEVKELSAWYGMTLAMRKVSLTVEPNRVTAVIGPSGCGKSTFIRCLNRMHEETPGARADGQVFLNGQDIYAPEVDPVAARRHIGMVFQRPVVFPTMSIFENVALGLRINGLGERRVLQERVERSLERAALWEEVKDKLYDPGTALSGGQQQRMCIARALAVEPAILLLDEPASALDPQSTLRIEELLHELKERYTVAIVTHNMQQTARVSDFTAFMLAGAERVGELVEFGPTRQIFTNPRDQRTEEYLTGRFG